MQILVAEQVRAWDQFTIQHEPVTSLNLMERAATALFEWLMQSGYKGRKFQVFCGKGNNGGDGLVIARLLALSGHQVTVFIMEYGHMGTEDFQTNLVRLHETNAVINYISLPENLHKGSPDDVIIDALLGTGLNRPADGLTGAIIEHINQSGCEIIAVDIPSGLFCDISSIGNIIVHATHTISFQCYKLAFLMPENALFTGRVHILPIGLHPAFIATIDTPYELVEPGLIQSIIRRRNQFANKGNFGFAALVAGSKGMMGAAVLSARACLRSGVGKLTCHIPSIGYTIMQTAVPEAMSSTEQQNVEYLEYLPSLEGYSAVGIGPGLGQHTSTAGLLKQVFQQSQRVLIDADGLNMLAKHKEWYNELPLHTVITPHVREFERLFGKTSDDFNRLQLARQQAEALNITIVLKGHFTAIITPGGKVWFNSTGNPGMATGGSGDVLTGIITSFLAQGYETEQAAIAGVYLHGLAGDIAASYHSQHSLIASDITEHLGKAFLQLIS